jgi:succinyl-CoA synthetase beta subunit
MPGYIIAFNKRKEDFLLKIHEYQAKDVFAKYGLPVPAGRVATTPQEAKAVAGEIGKPVVVKAQVLVGGRGKAGGVKLAKTPDEAFERAEDILALTIKGLPVEKVLVAEAVDIREEYYIGITIDRDRRKVVLIASPAGGVDIEEVAEKTPEKIAKVWVDPLMGVDQYAIRQALFKAGFEPKFVSKIAGMHAKLYEIFMDFDCSLVEINPLVITNDNELKAIDAKINFDDNGLFRHPDLREWREGDETDAIEKEAHRRGVTSYVRLPGGNVGIIGNGAGLVMATMDEVKRAGGNPANFLDVGGSATSDVVADGLEVVTMDEGVKGILINIFAGIARCDVIAEGLLKTMESMDIKVPIVVRMQGTNSEKGKEILAGTSMIPVDTLPEGAAKIVSLIKRGGVS